MSEFFDAERYKNATKISVLEGLFNSRASTYWILKSAYSDPNVIIVSRNEESRNKMEKLYHDEIDMDSTNNKLFNPLFISLESSRETIEEAMKTKKPIVFDNGCFL